VQISAPSRSHIHRYGELETEIRQVADAINLDFGRKGYLPIIHRVAHHDWKEVYRFYRAADVCLVTSLHDGMNLVAKEFVASRSDNGGALVLSSFAGASRELKDAFIVNPYDVDQTAAAIYHAISLDPEERSRRMERLRSTVVKNNAYAWAGHLLEEIYQIVEGKKTAWANSTTH
jgi:trehalose 6-phosphate synthase